MTVAFVMNTNAQTVIANDYGDGSMVTSGASNLNLSTTTANENEEKTDRQKRQSEVAFTYFHPKGGGGGAAGFDYVLHHFVMGIDYAWAKKNDYFKGFFGIHAYVGGNYRYFLVNRVYLEGRAMIGFGHETMDIVSGYSKYGNKQWKEEKSNYGYLAFSPRVGFLISEKVGVNVGYECDLWKFKNAGHRFAFGIVIVP